MSIDVQLYLAVLPLLSPPEELGRPLSFQAQLGPSLVLIKMQMTRWLFEILHFNKNEMLLQYA